ncbi:hypothetical protein VK792_18960 [Mesobacterium sp. TK19101]|uniref:Uncharacterized protein n=1 Tax=Mesobacterium hydrothermale TaxID=3111907 RepID=A0ABU6HQ58_9RHOB|nr:hypothetical protein [Mesobacterium sp. TK19101]MEC3863375.1 hypothetical protein [Mesobacterium sp. TK19101]
MSEVSLEEFVRETLLSIARGVRTAKDISQNEDIIPIALHRVNDQETKSGDQIVKFSVGVEANSRTGGGVKGQVGGPLVSLITGSVAAEGSHEKASAAIHRIEFGVPINFSARWKAQNSEGDK